MRLSHQEIESIIHAAVPDFVIAKYVGETPCYGYIHGCYESANDDLFFDSPVEALCHAFNQAVLERQDTIQLKAI